MQITNKVSFVGFLLAVSTMSIFTVEAGHTIPTNHDIPNKIETRLSRLTEAIKKRGINPLNPLEIEKGEITRGFANRSGGGGFVNRGGGGGGGFVNRGGGGGFVNSGPWGDRGSFYNRY